MAKERFMHDDAARGRDFVARQLKKEGFEANNVKDGIILGSGLGHFVEDHMDERSVHVPFGSVYNNLHINRGKGEAAPGHAQELVIGPLKRDSDTRLVMAQAGREHPYEGIDPKRATFWLRIMQLLEVETLFGSNAVGIVTPDTLDLPSLMLVKGHIDEVYNGPLVGRNELKFGSRFPHMGDLYPAQTRELVKKVAAEQNIPLEEGILFRKMGPPYESTTIVYDLRNRLEGIWRQARKQKGESGFDGPPVGAVGMSSTLEHEVRQHASPNQDNKDHVYLNRAFGQSAHVSACTNYACGMGPDGLGAFPSDTEVLENSEKVREIFGRLAREVILTMRQQ